MRSKNRSVPGKKKKRKHVKDALLMHPKRNLIFITIFRNKMKENLHRHKRFIFLTRWEDCSYVRCSMYMWLEAISAKFHFTWMRMTWMYL